MRSASLKRGNPKRPRQLRRASTRAESVFWNAVRNRQIDGAKFRRQWPVGKFVADFCCVQALLIVEIDGGQHDENKRDEIRTAALEKSGYRVIRFWNNEVLENMAGVLENLRTALAADPSPAR